MVSVQTILANGGAPVVRFVGDRGYLFHQGPVKHRDILMGCKNTIPINWGHALRNITLLSGTYVICE